MLLVARDGFGHLFPPTGEKGAKHAGPRFSELARFSLHLAIVLCVF